MIFIINSQASFAHAEAIKEWGNMAEVENLAEVLLSTHEVDNTRCGVMQAYCWITMLITGRFNQHMV